MKKKWISFLLSVLMLFSLCACGSTAAPAQEERTIAMICASSIEDGAWGESCYTAMVEAADKMGWKTMYKDSVPDSENYAVLEDFCRQGVDMIYASGEQYNDVVLEIAAQYPDVAFAVLNGSALTSGYAVNNNVVSVLPDPAQIGWMAGTMAALQTETGTLAFIGGMQLESTMGKYKAFRDAAEYVADKEGKSVKVLDCTYAGSFDDANKGETLANALMYKGADVFFGDASAVDTGVRNAITAHNTAAGKVEVFDIAQPFDMGDQYECVVTSIITDNTAMLTLVMTAYDSGFFGGITQYGSLQNATLSKGRYSPLVSAENQAKFDAYCQQMLEMTFMK